MRGRFFIFFVVVIIIIIDIFLPLLVFALGSHHHQHHHRQGFCEEEDANQLIPRMATVVGGLQDSTPPSNNAEIEDIARFAIQQHNRQENVVVELVKVVKAEEQVVAGTLHHLTLEVMEAGSRKLCEAKVWVKPWLNFKQLQEFKHLHDIPPFTPCDLGAKKDVYGFEWKTVPVHDPAVQDAASHALKIIQQRSNSLLPYQLHEILHAKAEVSEESAKFYLLLNVTRGEKEEKFKVEVHKTNEGDFHLNHMDQDRS